MQKSIKAGLALNHLLEEENPPYKSKINSFIERFSIKMHVKYMNYSKNHAIKHLFY